MEGTYEYELERAELLGVEPISREKWEEQEKARKEVEQEQEHAEVAKELENTEENLKGMTGKMGELNNILASTQQRLNKFKTVCGSFTSLLKIRTGSPAPPEDRAANGQAPTSSINDALDDLEQMKDPNQMLELNVQCVKRQAQDINQKVAKNMDALDSLLAKAENAELSLKHQNKQMQGYLSK